MGKAARNRARRKRKEDFAHKSIGARDAVLAILDIEGFDAFAGLLERHPELLSDSVRQEVARLTEVPAYGPLFLGVGELLATAPTDPRGAWNAFDNGRRAADASGKELSREEEQIDAAAASGAIQRALHLIDGALPGAMKLGFGLSVCELLHRRGLLLLRLSTARRAEEVEEALETFAEALRVAMPGEQAARILMHSGLAYGERVKGDPSRNLDLAISSLRGGLAQLEDVDAGDLRPMMQTNLAVALVRSGRDRLAAAHEAVELCHQALACRSPERDANNWAYSQINLGYALQSVAELGNGELDDARAAYEAVLAQSDVVTDQALLGGAHQALGRLELKAASSSPEQMVDAHAAGQLDELFDNTVALRSAREHLATALALIPMEPNTLRYAEILDDLSSALDQLDQEEDALSLAREGLSLVSPESSPVTCKNIAWRVGAILSKREDWTGAASAFRTALDAAEITVHARHGSGRADEIRRVGNLHRWAAYAFARANDLRAAAIALDSGRARELQQRLAHSTEDEEALGRVPIEMRARYEAALAAFTDSAIEIEDTAVSLRLAEAIAAIRDLPGLAHFRTGALWADISAAVEPAYPVVYVDPTPNGTAFLMLHRQDEHTVSAEARFTDVTSTEVFMHMFIRGGKLDDGEHAGSYLLAASAQADDRDVAGGLDELLPWLSQAIARPLVELLESANLNAATLVLCGPLEMAPLHAAPLATVDGVLADRFTFRYAPSAKICAAAISRAGPASQVPRRLVALADPDGSLPAAQPEVKEIADLFDSGMSDCAVGAAATVGFMKRHASRASHLHLACHARSGIFDANEAVLALASGPLPARTLTTVAPLKTRLVVVSACQSAQPTMGGLHQTEFRLLSHSSQLAAPASSQASGLWMISQRH